MLRRNRFVRHKKIQEYIEMRFAPLNPVQKKVATSLTEYASTHSIRLSRRAVQYLFDEIEGDKIVDLTPEAAVVTLGVVLAEVEKRKRNDREISFAVLVRTFREWDCPHPWC